MCQSPHSLTASERYSLFQLTAGLSLATGEHAGKWVTVNTACLTHICSTGTLSTPRKCMTPRQRTKETMSKCATLLQKSQQLFCRVEVQRDDMCAPLPLSCFSMMDCSGSEWKCFLLIQRLVSEPGRMMVLRQSQYCGDEVRLRYSVGSNQGNFQDEKTTPRINVCVLCREAWFTHMAAERTCWIKGDSVVLLEHDCWI